jgi:phage tail-like protein
MAVAQRRDPYLSFCFTVEIAQQVVAGFSEVSGLSFETEVETFREGGVNRYERQLTGPTKNPSRLTLKRGLSDEALWSWYEDVMNGTIQRKDIAVLLLNSASEECKRWTFSKACPVKWVGPDFRAGTTEIAFETVELVHEGLLPNSNQPVTGRLYAPYVISIAVQLRF